MTKELKALREIGKLKENGCYINTTEEYKLVEAALKELIDIKSGKIRLSVNTGDNYVAMPKYQYEQDLKKLKALEIIKEKNINVRGIINSPTLEHYIDHCMPRNSKEPTQEEYDLLKEVLL